MHFRLVPAREFRHRSLSARAELIMPDLPVAARLSAAGATFKNNPHANIATAIFTALNFLCKPTPRSWKT
jgi:hypothetical protein